MKHQRNQATQTWCEQSGKSSGTRTQILFGIEKGLLSLCLQDPEPNFCRGWLESRALGLTRGLQILPPLLYQECIAQILLARHSVCKTVMMTVPPTSQGFYEDDQNAHKFLVTVRPQ